MIDNLYYHKFEKRSIDPSFDIEILIEDDRWYNFLHEYYSSAGALAMIVNLKEIAYLTYVMVYNLIACDNTITKNLSAQITQFYNTTLCLSHIMYELLLSNNDNLQLLNYECRNVNRPTDVLSFPLNDIVDLNGNDIFHMGSIVVSYDFICSESDSQDYNQLHHFKHLCVHSLLHLIGFDHIDQKEGDIMEELEYKILSQYS